MSAPIRFCWNQETREKAALLLDLDEVADRFAFAVSRLWAGIRDDYLRQVAHDYGLPLACVRKVADCFGDREDVGTLIMICETRYVRGAAKCRTQESADSSEMFSDDRREKVFAT